ncbi:MAG: ferredoxin [Acidobacteria bacterium]|nr:MAG: ferredoxin [Acidobacteriota bacterium]REK02770.1 MAG: ferredoxin [Acidobacteriota bacterium]REK13425.1 MAG: ferredoxin [Acidobacteriota bacterium]REK41419.1 MAG: ferredoxin [Acidobacteriota bacterium]
MPDQFEDLREAEELSEDEERLLDELGITGESRRRFLGQVGVAGFSIFAMQVIAQRQALAAGGTYSEAAADPISLENAVKVVFKVNGEKKTVEVDSRMTLLDTLREKLDLTGSKKGCDHGQCGACTVIADGQRVLSCLTLAATCEGKEVTTIEGLAKGEELHPMQSAFIKYDAFQCGYCTPGQICSAVALIDEAARGDASYVTAVEGGSNTKLSDDDIRERMSGNICRCGAYPNILKAVKEVHKGEETAATWKFHRPDEKAGADKEVADETV